MNVLFVCTGNTCRSPMCAAYLRHLAAPVASGLVLRVESAGISASDGAAASANARLALAEFHTDIELHRSRQLRREHLNAADLVIALGASHRDAILRLCPEAAGKTRLLLSWSSDSSQESVPDPYGGDAACYRACFNVMRPPLERLFSELSSPLSRHFLDS